jgi:hypothetical protein
MMFLLQPNDTAPVPAVGPLWGPFAVGEAGFLVPRFSPAAFSAQRKAGPRGPQLFNEKER